MKTPLAANQQKDAWPLALIVGMTVGALALAAILAIAPLVGLGLAGVILALLAGLVITQYASLGWFSRVLIIGLPLHTLMMMFLYGTLRVPAGIITALATWKEALALCLAGVFMLRSLPTLARGRLRITLADILALAFGAWVMGRLLWSHLDGTAVPLQAQVYGLRFYIIPLALYVIGRLAPLSERGREQIYWMLVILGGVTSLFAIIENMLPDSLWFMSLRVIGYYAYFNEYATGAAMWGPGGTSASMWAYVGGRFIRRSGSLYMVSKPFAFTYLLIIPIILTLLWTDRGAKKKLWLWLCLLLSAIGILLTGTRATIGVVPLIFVAMAFLLRRWNLWFFSMIGGFMLLMVLLSQPVVQGYIDSMLSGEDSSTRQHLTGWVDGLTQQGAPWLAGFGVGTANQENLRFALDPGVYRLGVVSESIYVQILQELGIVGGVLYLGLMLALVRRANRFVRTRNLHHVQTGLIVRWMTIAILLVSFVAIPWQNALITTYFFWLLAGQLSHMPLVRREEKATNG
jgi:O-Antigen ligase